jgi:hypothetical protein
VAFFQLVFGFGGFCLESCIWISLDRFSECDPQEGFLVHIPGWFGLQSIILAFLTPAESHRYLRTCVYLLLDTRDLLLNATALRIQYFGSFSVATPPVQPALQPAVGQGGGAWDLEFSGSSESSGSSETSEAVESHAMEVENVDRVQGV